MRKLIVTVTSTLDGYAAGEGGNIFVMPIDLGFDRYNLERMRTADAVLLGASTFRGARDYWPSIADDDTAPEVEREISSLYRTLRKVVVSDTLGTADTASWAASTTIISRADAPQRVGELKDGGDGDIVCFGSLTTWDALLAAGLVDELHILVGPGAIGAGVPTFRRSPGQPLTLLDARLLDDSALVALRYAVGARPSAH